MTDTPVYQENRKTGWIMQGVGGRYTVRPFPVANGQKLPDAVCRARGIFRLEKTAPLPGDRVVYREGNGEEEPVIEEILPRDNVLIRPAMANVTHLLLVVPVRRPEPDLLVLDKLISIAEEKSVTPVVVVHKTDLDGEKAKEISGIYEKAGIPVYETNLKTREGTESLRAYLRAAETEKDGCVFALCGVSGAGKSSLVHELFPEVAPETGAVSRKTERGRHTTREVVLYATSENGRSFLADTPGFSMIDLLNFNFFPTENLPWTFREFRPFLTGCRYTKCTHTKEEGCAVLEAVRGGVISPV
ncbi:MAG: ribosome small subunit-dependent GTPase A, partial [Clostridia bacterium]|nr:ribosome small subunit-dependent GTPase A [Clostridia bacterium]